MPRWRTWWSNQRSVRLQPPHSGVVMDSFIGFASDLDEFEFECEGRSQH